MDRDQALGVAAEAAARFLDGVDERRVWPEMGEDELRERLAVPLADEGLDPETVVAELADGADPGLVATAGPRYFGFVIGGSLPAALGADWLVSAWDQFGSGGPVSPAMTVVEEVAARWSLDLLGLPAGRVGGLRHRRPERQHDVPRRRAPRGAAPRRAGTSSTTGWPAAPPVRVIVGDEAHVTIFRALRLLGLRRRHRRARARRRPGADAPGELRRRRSPRAPGRRSCARRPATSTAARSTRCDEIAALCARAGAWLHVDGAFGLWAAASPSLRGLVRGAERADSWGIDAHKWLNVPYDCAMAIVADREAHLASMDLSAPYLEERRTDWSGPAGPGVLAPPARRHGLRGDPVAGSPRRRRPRRPLLRPRAD